MTALTNPPATERGADEGHSRSRSMVISVVGGLALLLLALTVFAVASQARSLSTQAERSVQTVENLRVVSLARAEISVASRIKSTAPNETAVIAGAIGNAIAHLESVEANFDENVSEDVRVAFTAFRLAVDTQAELLGQQTADGDLLRSAEVETGAAFVTLGEAMRAEQLEAFTGLEADNDLMNLIATVATFMVAFVVPSAALFVFQSLRSAPREMRVLQLQYDRLAKRSHAMASTISSEAAELRNDLTVAPGSTTTSQVKNALARFAHIAVINGAPTSVRNEPVDINDVVASAVSNVDSPTPIRVTTAQAPVTATDPDLLEAVATELIANGIAHGEAPMQVAAISKSDQIEIQFVDSGNGLPDEVVDALLHEQEYELREETLDGTYGYGLITARRSLESIGGTLRYQRNEGRTHLIATLPIVRAKAQSRFEQPLAA